MRTGPPVHLVEAVEGVVAVAVLTALVSVVECLADNAVAVRRVEDVLSAKGGRKPPPHPLSFYNIIHYIQLIYILIIRINISFLEL